MEQNTIVEAAVDIDRPVAATFSGALDIDRWRNWQSRFTEVEMTSEGAHGLGTAIRTVTEALGNRYESRSEVTEFVENAAVTYKGNSDAIAFEARWTFAETSGGTTRVTVQMESTPRGGALVRLVHPWMSRVFRRRLEADLEGLKIMLEAEA